MKRTLFAVGVALLVSMLLVPDAHWRGCTVCVVFERSGFTPFFLVNRIEWGQFILQTVFLSVLAAMLVNWAAMLVNGNLLPRKPGK